MSILSVVQLFRRDIVDRVTEMIQGTNQVLEQIRQYITWTISNCKPLFISEILAYNKKS